MASSKFVRMSLQVAILGTGAFLAIQQLISPGIMIAASIVMGRALAPVEQAVGQWKQFVNARSSHKRLKQLFDSVSEQEERTELPEPKGKLKVEQLFATVPGTRDTCSGGSASRSTPGRFLPSSARAGPARPPLSGILSVRWPRPPGPCGWTARRCITGIPSSLGVTSAICPRT